MAGPGDETAPDRAGRDRLRASHADREQVIDILKAAFVQGRLTKDEFEARIGQALASRTCAELAAITTDLPGGRPAAQRSKPAGAQDPKPVLRPGPVIMAASALYAGLWALAIFFPNDPLDGAVAYALAMLTLFIVAGMIGFGIAKLALWHQQRSRRQLPRGAPPGAGGQPSGRLPSGGQAGQLPPINDRQQQTAEAAPSRLRRPQWPGWGSPRRWRPRGVLGAGATIAVQLAWH